MIAKTKRDVGARIFAVHVEHFAVFKFVFVAIRGCKETEHAIAGPNFDAGDLDRLFCKASPRYDRWPEPQNFLNRPRNQLRILRKLCPRTFLLQ